MLCRSRTMLSEELLRVPQMYYAIKKERVMVRIVEYGMSDVGQVQKMCIRDSGIIDSFRKGDRDNVAVWLEKQGRPFYVNYMAVRDQNNNYIGTLELVQDMQFAKDHFARTK